MARERPRSADPPVASDDDGEAEPAVNLDDTPRSVLVPLAVPVPTQVPAGRPGLGAAWPVDAPIRTAASTVPATAACGRRCA